MVKFKGMEKLFQTSKYNDPSIKDATPLMQLVGEEKDSFELAVLTYKIHAAAELTEQGILPKEKEGAKLSFGIQIPIDNNTFRVDLVDEFEDGSVIAVRCLAANERLHEAEAGFWENILNNKMTRKVLFVHQAELHPIDKVFIEILKKNYTNTESVLIK